MAMRVIDPPYAEFDKLPTLPTTGERRLIELFDAELSPDWEIYFQPYLNGLRPDVVLLNPFVGIAVFEIKDWNLSAMHYFSQGEKSPQLFAENNHGHKFSLEKNNPIRKIQQYKDEIYEIYCPRLDERAGLAVITAGVIFTKSPRADVERLFRPIRASYQSMRVHPQYYPIAASEDVAEGRLDRIFPEYQRTSSAHMNTTKADDLRAWLREPYFGRQQRQPLQFDDTQYRLVSTRAPSGFRRIRGPAGSGKTVVLAARAAELAAVGKHVLVVTFNITLLNYVRDLSARHTTSRRVIRRQIEFLNFHYWCKRVCLENGFVEEYTTLWRPSEVELDEARYEQQRDMALERDLAELVQRLYDEDEGQLLPKYDAILVDEGQDFQPSWWQALRRALAKDGEMILSADKTQDVYGTAVAWTDGAMANAGFRGPWSRLDLSYRLPPRVVSIVSEFANEFMRGEEVDLPNAPPQAELFPVELRWIQVQDPQNTPTICEAEVLRLITHLPKDTAVADVVFLSGMKVGGRVASLLEGRRIRVLHTYGEGRTNRRQKRAFFQGAAQVKATTLHSFKGWEARNLVVLVDSIERPEERAVVYTAMSRLLRHGSGCCLTVVCSCQELASFGRSHFDDYERR